MSMPNTNKRVKEIRPKTRRKFSSEEKVSARQYRYSGMLGSVNGERLWLISELFETDLEFYESYPLEMFEVVDGEFGSPQSGPTLWGTIDITLVDCDSGHASFNGLDGRPEMNLVRLTGLTDSTCIPDL